MTDRVRVTAPVRVLDAGGWTDTWFARSGLVCHLAVGPGVEVTVRRLPASAVDEPVLDLSLLSFGERYRFRPGAGPGRHPLIEAAARWAPPGAALEVEVGSSVPPGSGLGTSAAATVAFIAALTAISGRSIEGEELVSAAHRVETQDLGLESGVQDQVASTYGGANLVTVDPYPRVSVSPLALSEDTWAALSRRIVTVFLGRPHRSASVHAAVVERLRGTDAEALLAPLRSQARRAAEALVSGDLERYARAMIANTHGQAALHPGLVGPRAREVIAIASAHGAVGWKVNGAGGDGGSVTVIGPDDPGGLVSALRATPGLAVLDVGPARRGVAVDLVL